MMKQQVHLRAMPASPPVLLARASGRDDCKQTIRALTTALADKEEIIAEMQEALDEAGETLADALASLADTAADRDHWAARAVRAEATLWGALCLAWWHLRDLWAAARAADDAPPWLWPSLAVLVMFAAVFVRF